MKRRTLLAAAIAAIFPKPPALPPVFDAADFVFTPVQGFTIEGFTGVIGRYEGLSYVTFAHSDWLPDLKGDAS